MKWATGPWSRDTEAQWSSVPRPQCLGRAATLCWFTPYTYIMALRPADGTSSEVCQRIKSDPSMLAENELCMRPWAGTPEWTHILSCSFLACCVHYSRHVGDFNKQEPSGPHLTYSLGPGCGLGGFSVPPSQLFCSISCVYPQR